MPYYCEHGDGDPELLWFGMDFPDDGTQYTDKDTPVYAEDGGGDRELFGIGTGFCGNRNQDLGKGILAFRGVGSVSPKQFCD